MRKWWQLAALGAGLLIALALLPEPSQAFDYHRDDFTNGELKGGWIVKRADYSAWTITNTALHIDLEYGDLWDTYTNNCRNLFLRKAPHGNYAIETHLTADLQAGINQALIVLYLDDNNYLRFGIVRDRDGHIYVNHVHELAGVPAPQTFNLYDSGDVYLRIAWIDGVASMYYSSDGSNWHFHDSVVALGFEPPQVGLVAFDGSEPSSNSTVDYDYFAITGACAKITERYDPGAGNKIVVRWVVDPSLPASTRAFLSDGPPGALGATTFSSDIMAFSSDTLIWVATDLLPNGFYFSWVECEGSGGSGDPIPMSPDVDAHCSYPAVLVHGWRSGPSIWNTGLNMVEQLQAYGMAHVFTPLIPPTGLSGDYDFAQCAQQLGTQIDAYIDDLEATNRRVAGTDIQARTINIVAHSMGGIVSRRLLNTPFRESVLNLVELGTPNGGLHAANMVYRLGGYALGGACSLDPALCYLSEDNMRLFNSAFASVGTTRVTVVAGVGHQAYCSDESVDDCPAPAVGFLGNMFMSWQEGCPNDGVVSLASAHAPEISAFTRTIVGECHTELHQSSEVLYDWVLPILTEVPSSRPLSSSKRAFDDSGASGSPSILEAVGPLPAAATLSDTFDFEGGRLRVLFLTSSGIGSMQLVSPTGLIFDSTLAASDTNIVFSRVGLMVAVSVSNAAPGHWRINITNSPGAPATAYGLAVRGGASAILRLQGVNPDLPTNGRSIVSACLQSSGSVPPMMLSATLTSRRLSNGTRTVMATRDDGIAPDTTAGDGVFTGAFAPDGGVGLYELTVHAKGLSGTAGFDRSSYQTVLVHDAGVLDTPPAASDDSRSVRVSVLGNPGQRGLRVRLSLARPLTTRVDVVDVTGRLICTLANRLFPAGSSEVAWEGSECSGQRAQAGVYLVAVTAGGKRFATKGVIVR